MRITSLKEGNLILHPTKLENFFLLLSGLSSKGLQWLGHTGAGPQEGSRPLPFTLRLLPLGVLSWRLFWSVVWGSVPGASTEEGWGVGTQEAGKRLSKRMGGHVHDLRSAWQWFWVDLRACVHELPTYSSSSVYVFFLRKPYCPTAFVL